MVAAIRADGEGLVVEGLTDLEESGRSARSQNRTRWHPSETVCDGYIVVVSGSVTAIDGHGCCIVG